MFSQFPATIGEVPAQTQKVDETISPLLLSTDDVAGGAARSTYRLHQGLRAIGIASRMLVRSKESADPTIITARELASGYVQEMAIRFGYGLDHLPLRIMSQRPSETWGTAWFPNGLAHIVRSLAPNVVHLHWVAGGFMPVGMLPRLGLPLVWTLRDEWAYTGGCHYTADCIRFQQSCGRCPHLGSRREYDITRWTWERKHRSWNSLRITIVALSRWLAERAVQSTLLGKQRIVVIPNGIDTTCYRPLDKSTARQLLNLPQTARLVLFGAVNATSDPRKGFQLLQPALAALRQMVETWPVHLVVFGAEASPNAPDMAFPTHYLGKLYDDVSLALAYSAADVVVVPSIQEAFGLVAAEAQACGTPAVAFDGTGLRDVIDHQQTGYLARPYEVEDLARGIRWVLEDGERWRELSRRARVKVEAEFELTHIARRYADLYAEVLATHRARPQRG